MRPVVRYRLARLISSSRRLQRSPSVPITPAHNQSSLSLGRRDSQSMASQLCTTTSSMRCVDDADDSIQWTQGWDAVPSGAKGFDNTAHISVSETRGAGYTFTGMWICASGIPCYRLSYPGIGVYISVYGYQTPFPNQGVPDNGCSSYGLDSRNAAKTQICRPVPDQENGDLTTLIYKSPSLNFSQHTLWFDNLGANITIDFFEVGLSLDSTTDAGPTTSPQGPSISTDSTATASLSTSFDASTASPSASTDTSRATASEPEKLTLSTSSSSSMPMQGSLTPSPSHTSSISVSEPSSPVNAPTTSSPHAITPASRSSHTDTHVVPIVGGLLGATLLMVTVASVVAFRVFYRKRHRGGEYNAMPTWIGMENKRVSGKPSLASASESTVTIHEIEGQIIHHANNSCTSIVPSANTECTSQHNHFRPPNGGTGEGSMSRSSTHRGRGAIQDSSEGYTIVAQTLVEGEYQSAEDQVVLVLPLTFAVGLFRGRGTQPAQASRLRRPEVPNAKPKFNTLSGVGMLLLVRVRLHRLCRSFPRNTRRSSNINSATRVL